MKMFALWGGGFLFVLAVWAISLKITPDPWAPAAWLPPVLALAAVLGTWIYLGRR